MLLIDNPAVDKTQLPFLGATVNGTATTISIDDIIAAEGERVPNVSTSQKQFNVGYILLVRHGDSMGQAAQALDVVSKGFAGRFADQTNGIGSIANVPATLEVVFDTPADNSTITGPSVQVTGAVINTTGVETGVTVNGMPATVTGNRFIANAVELQQGTNTLTVTATDVNALTNTATRSVTAQVGNYVRLVPNIDSGTAPLNATFTVSGSFTITNSQLSYTGPADIYLTGTPTVTSYPILFPQEGIYTLTVTVSGPDGLTYEDSVMITVYSQSKFDSLLRAKWQTVNSYLSNRNPDPALNHFLTTSRSKYQAIFSEITPLLPDIVATHQGLTLINMDSEMAKYELTTLEPDGLHAYDIVFVKDDDGIWRIRSY